LNLIKVGSEYLKILRLKTSSFATLARDEPQRGHSPAFHALDFIRCNNRSASS